VPVRKKSRQPGTDVDPDWYREAIAVTPPATAIVISAV
jgi:hypothetical protein